MTRACKQLVMDFVHTEEDHTFEKIPKKGHMMFVQFWMLPTKAFIWKLPVLVDPPAEKRRVYVLKKPVSKKEMNLKEQTCATLFY